MIGKWAGGQHEFLLLEGRRHVRVGDVSAHVEADMRVRQAAPGSGCPGDGVVTRTLVGVT